jgi:hypothetical protein
METTADPFGMTTNKSNGRSLRNDNKKQATAATGGVNYPLLNGFF